MRRRRLEADIVTPEFILAALNCRPIRRLFRTCIELTRADRIEYEFEVVAQFRGSIIAHSPLVPGTREWVDAQQEVLRQLLEPWHITEDRPSHKPLTSVFTLISAHSYPLERRELLKGLPSIYNHEKKEGDLYDTILLRRAIVDDHRPEVMRPIGIELRVRADTNFCSIFQERERVSLNRLAQLDRRLRDEYRLNGAAQAVFTECGFNLIEASVGRQGFSLSAAQLEAFAFAPGHYVGK